MGIRNIKISIPSNAFNVRKKNIKNTIQKCKLISYVLMPSSNSWLLASYSNPSLYVTKALSYSIMKYIALHPSWYNPLRMLDKVQYISRHPLNYLTNCPQLSISCCSVTISLKALKSLDR